jgi:hypothetical protein
MPSVFHYTDTAGAVGILIRLFGEWAKLPIVSVIVGPHPNQSLQKDAIERLLEQKGIAASVRLSSIPFRG